MSVVERQDRGCEGGMGGEAQGHPEPPSEARDVGTGPSVAREAGVTTSSPQCTERPKWCTPMDMAEKAEGEARQTWTKIEVAEPKRTAELVTGG